MSLRFCPFLSAFQFLAWFFFFVLSCFHCNFFLRSSSTVSHMRLENEIESKKFVANLHAPQNVSVRWVHSMHEHMQRISCLASLCVLFVLQLVSVWFFILHKRNHALDWISAKWKMQFIGCFLVSCRLPFVCVCVYLFLPFSFCSSSLFYDIFFLNTFIWNRMLRTSCYHRVWLTNLTSKTFLST